MQCTLWKVVFFALCSPKTGMPRQDFAPDCALNFSTWKSVTQNVSSIEIRIVKSQSCADKNPVTRVTMPMSNCLNQDELIRQLSVCGIGFLLRNSFKWICANPYAALCSNTKRWCNLPLQCVCLKRKGLKAKCVFVLLRYTSTKAFLATLNEMNDYAGQHEVISENMTSLITGELTRYVQELKQERKSVIDHFLFFTVLCYLKWVINDRGVQC